MFTKFYQAYYLPVKFGYDKRRIHLSNLILSGQMTRAEAERELALELYPSEKLLADKEFVAKKLGITLSAFEAILVAPAHAHDEYPTNTRMVRNYQAGMLRLKKILGRVPSLA